MGMLTVINSITLLAGFTLYKYYLEDTSWRLNYIGTTCVGLVFSLLQLLLVTRVTKKMGIGDFGFSAGTHLTLTLTLLSKSNYGRADCRVSGDTAFASFVSGIQFMPCVLIALALCPPGQEGVAFSVFTTFSNLGQSVGNALGNGVVRIWDCSNDTISRHEYGGVWRLTVLTSLLQIVPIAWVCILPSGREDLAQLKGRSFGWGIFFVVLFILSLTVVVSDSIYELG